MPRHSPSTSNALSKISCSGTYWGEPIYHKVRTSLASDRPQVERKLPLLRLESFTPAMLDKQL